MKYDKRVTNEWPKGMWERREGQTVMKQKAEVYGPW